MVKKRGLQREDYLCGPASLQRAFRQYGVKLSQARIADACGTDEDGTDDQDLYRGILHFGFDFDAYETDIWNEGLAWLDQCITKGTPVIICVDDWTHWVCVYGGLGAQGNMRYNVFDPGRFDWNLEEYGHNMYTRRDLIRRWRCSKEARLKAECPESLAYWGVAIYDRTASNKDSRGSDDPSEKGAGK